ncbi:tyrosine-protein phosphatase [Lacticaseibacillus hulanensis]|uniref:tyrosine-protein phosphatase n=1 Tax=Lacticaseibacillus hulanensis TaxID=2493111 RepID=UPI0013E2D274|nr:tyrosine-protein phosphatase [Lacticaseibacillus hulanensis]
MTTDYILPRGAAPLDFVHIRNARTYRGLKTADGNWVRDDMLVRTARLSSASAADLAHLRDIGVTAVVDLRLLPETEANPDLRVPQIDYVHAPMASDQVTADNPGLLQLFTYLRGHDDAHEQMEQGYAKIVTDKVQRASLARFVKTAIKTPGSVAFHCSMGKDRTGVAAAIMLAALGVDRQFINADYMYSNAANAQHMQALTQKLSEHHGTDVMRTNLLALAATDTDYLDAAFSAIHAQFGDVATFMRSGLGLGDAGMAKMRAKFLVD